MRGRPPSRTDLAAVVQAEHHGTSFTADIHVDVDEIDCDLVIGRGDAIGRFLGDGPRAVSRARTWVEVGLTWAAPDEVVRRAKYLIRKQRYGRSRSR